MSESEIKFKTIQLVNGTKHMSKGLLDDFKYYVCHVLEIDKSEKNFKIVEDAVKIYFETQDSMSIN